MKRYFKFGLPLIILAGLAAGIFYWQYQSPVAQQLKKTFSESDSLEDFYKTAQQINNQPTETEISFMAVGDIMLSRNVAGTMAKAGKDPYLPFRALENELHSTDFNFANLESPFSGRDDFNPTGSLVFNAPTWTLPGLGQYNFKVLNLANNHAMDQGQAALLYTKKYLADNSLNGIGVGNNLDEAWQGDIFSVKGVTVGFIGASYSTLNDNGVATNNYVARIEDVTRLKKSIANMKTKADFVVVTMHAGTEYTRTPNQSQIDFAHAAIDNGADIIIGAHPHWIQTTENYKGKQIFYSLGNFVFDQMWSQETKEGLMLKISLIKNSSCDPQTNQYSPSKQQQVACGDDVQGTRTGAQIKQIELFPVIIENYSTPRLANETEKQNILQKINITNPIIK